MDDEGWRRVSSSFEGTNVRSTFYFYIKSIVIIMDGDFILF